MTPMARAMHNGEWLSKASIVGVDRDPVDDDTPTCYLPLLSETVAHTQAELEGRIAATARAAQG